MKRKCSYLFVASMLAVAGMGCGDDDSVSTRDSGTTTRDSGTTITRDSGTVVRDSGTSDSSTSDAAADSGPQETFITLRFAHFIDGAGDVGVCANTGSEITLLNTLLNAVTPPPLSEEDITDFLLAPASALPAGTTLEVYEFGDISGTTCPDGSGSETPVISIALADLNIDPAKAYTVAAIGDLDSDEMETQPTLFAHEEVLAPMDSSLLSIAFVNVRAGTEPTLLCLNDSEDTDLTASDPDGVEYGETTRVEIDRAVLDGIGSSNKMFLLGLPGMDETRCADGDFFGAVEGGDAPFTAIPDMNGAAVTIFYNPIERLITVVNTAPAS